MNTEEHPPKARLAFRVGVVGRRPDRLPTLDRPQLETNIERVLAIIQSAVQEFHKKHSGQRNPYTNDDPVLRVVSSIAEGGDRIVARKALDLGFELHAPLPFHRFDYASDFETPNDPHEPGAREQYQELLEWNGKAGRPVFFEMDGARKPDPNDEKDTRETKAYIAAGRVVVHQSDVLVAVWEGDEDRSEAGTLHRIREALQYRIPVIWIHAAAPHALRLLREIENLPEPGSSTILSEPLSAQAFAGELKDIVDRLIEPPEERPRPKQTTDGRPTHREPEIGREDYFSESQPPCNFWFWWKMFRDGLSGDWRSEKKHDFPVIPVTDFEDAVLCKWPDVDGQIGSWINPRLRKYYAWSDKLADFNADRYRSAFVLIFLLGAAAVLLALFSRAMGWEDGFHFRREVACAAVEASMICTIVFLVLRNWWREWHLRWIEYRLVAELVRQLRFLVPLGGPRPLYRIAIQEHQRSYGDPAETWMLWYVRAVACQIGLPPVKVNREYLVDYIDFVRRRMSIDQLEFHTNTERRSHLIDFRLRWLGTLTFIITFFFVLTHGGGLVWSNNSEKEPFWYERAVPWMIVCCAFLPALASAFSAIRNQGEFLRLRRRSTAMKDTFSRIEKKLLELRESPDLNSTKLSDLAAEVSELMVNEFLDWRVIFKDREVEFG